MHVAALETGLLVELAGIKPAYIVVSKYRCLDLDPADTPSRFRRHTDRSLRSMLRARAPAPLRVAVCSITTRNVRGTLRKPALRGPSQSGSGSGASQLTNSGSLSFPSLQGSKQAQGKAPAHSLVQGRLGGV